MNTYLVQTATVGSSCHWYGMPASCKHRAQLAPAPGGNLQIGPQVDLAGTSHVFHGAGLPAAGADVDAGGRHDPAPEAAAQALPDVRPVEQRQHHGGRLDDRRQLLGRRVQVIALDADHHQVGRGGLLEAVGGQVRSDQDGGAVRPDQPEPPVSDGRQVGPAGDEGDLPAGCGEAEGQAGADHPADPADADHGDGADGCRIAHPAFCPGSARRRKLPVPGGCACGWTKAHPRITVRSTKEGDRGHAPERLGPGRGRLDHRAAGQTAHGRKLRAQRGAGPPRDPGHDPAGGQRLPGRLDEHPRPGPVGRGGPPAGGEADRPVRAGPRQGAGPTSAAARACWPTS